VAFWFCGAYNFSFLLKPKYALDDTINCLCFAFLVVFLGNIMVWVRLESYEARRLLTIEKETVVLTGLSNRRKLFEILANLETANIEKPSGIMMIISITTKSLMTTNGHTAG
jgi:hypothetical protein